MSDRGPKPCDCCQQVADLRRVVAVYDRTEVNLLVCRRCWNRWKLLSKGRYQPRGMTEMQLKADRLRLRAEQHTTS